MGISGFWVVGDLRCLCFRRLCERRGVWIWKLPCLGATCDFDLPRFMDHSLIGLSDFADLLADCLEGLVPRIVGFFGIRVLGILGSC